MMDQFVDDGASEPGYQFSDETRIGTSKDWTEREDELEAEVKNIAKSESDKFLNFVF